MPNNNQSFRFKISRKSWLFIFNLVTN